MIKKKSKMNKIIMWGLIATASVSLASVGFASWVINTMVGTNGDNINVQIGKVENLSVTAALKAVGTGSATDLTVSFDNDNKNTEVGNGDGGKEDLEFAFEYTLRKEGESSVAHAIKEVEISFTGISNVLTQMVSKKYIVSPISEGSKTIIAIDENGTGTVGPNTTDNPNHKITYTNNEITIISKYSFKWGTAFNGKNPSQKEIGVGATDWQAALTDFTGLASSNPVKFTATIKPVARY